MPPKYSQHYRSEWEQMLDFKDWWKMIRRRPIDAVDQLTHERGQCLANDCEVRKIFLELRECTKRVQGKSYTMETCAQETVDLIEALDHCVADKAFAKMR